jgi:hypothetical protein
MYWKKYLKYIAIVWICWHVLATLIYSLHWPAQGWMASITYRYMVPFFHQNWSLFAPNIPEYDAQLIYRVDLASENEMDKPWSDVCAGNRHDDFSKMEVIEQNILVQLAYQMHANYYRVNGKPQLDVLMRTAAYNKALYFAGRMHEAHQGAWNNLQIAVVFRFPENRGGQVDTLVFPAFYKDEIKR